MDGGIVTSAELTSITVDGNIVEQLQLDKTNTILITTNLKTNTYGTPRVYYTTTSPSGYAECGNVVVASNAEGYMTIQCETTPTTVATGLTLHIVPKGTPSSTNPSEMTGDPFCSDGTYQANTSECEAGEWKWGSFTVALPDIATPPRLMSEISSMQEMTPEFCASVTMDSPGNTARLKDERDGKYYWVAKLKDGNCWMTQNLDLDLESGKSLTPRDSDVSSNWDPGATTYDSYSDGNSGSSYYNTVQSWSPGGRDQLFAWSDLNSDSGCNYESSTCSNWTNVTNLTPMISVREDGVVIDGSTYDAHYLAGNYYSWEAATAGTGHSYTSAGAEAPDSICPAGWRLPLSRYSNNTVSGSFYNFLNQYGFTSSTGSGANSITRAPLFFVRSGYVLSTNRLDDAGYGGYYWSSVASSSSGAYSLYFLSSTVVPSGSISRYVGHSVRCVAPSAWSA